MADESSPHAPPMRFFDGSILPRRFRVRNSRATLWEWQNLCGSRVLGAFGWLQAKISFGLLDRQIIDAPKPFLEGLCDAACLSDRIHGFFAEVVDNARCLGFDEAMFEIARSTGVPCTGAAVRMRHGSGDFFLQSVASAAGPMMQGETHIISASRSTAGLETYATSNGRPKYKRPPGAHAQYFRGCGVPMLLQHHREWPLLQTVETLRILTLEQLAEIMDEMTAKYFRTMIERGILEPEP